MTHLSLHWPAAFSLQHDATLKWLSINRISREITNKATILFLPIFLFLLGQKLPIPGQIPDWTKGILLVVGYQLLLRCLMLLGLLPLNRMTSKMTTGSVFVISYVFRCLFFALLLLVSDMPIILLAVAVIEAIEVSLYWPRYNTLLAQQSQRQSLGGNLGVIQFMMQLLGVLAPLLAVVIAATVGSSAVFLLGIIGSLVGLISALHIHAPAERDLISLTEFFQWLKEHRYHRYILAVGGRMLNDMMLSLWPLYVFLLFGSLVKVGFLVTLSLWIALVVTVIAGLQIDKLRTAKMFRMSGGILALVWLARTSVITPMGIALLDSIDKIVSSSHWLFFDMISFRRSQGSQAFSYFVYQEIVSNAWIVVIWLVTLLVLLISHSWQILFVFGSIGVLLTLLLQGKHSEPVS